MKSFVAFALVVCSLAATALAADVPAPQPVAEHEWLEQFVGEWDSVATAVIEPGQPPMVCKGREEIRPVGKLWIVAESSATMNGQPTSARLTLGYDPELKKYVGTWIDSMTPYLWKYEGTVDPTGKILTLETEGPNCMSPGTKARFREVIEFKSPDHKVMTSKLEAGKDQWVPFVTVEYHRAK